MTEARNSVYIYERFSERERKPKRRNTNEKIRKVVFFFFLIFYLFRAAPAAYGGFQARGPSRAVAASPHHSQNNDRSKPCMQPTPQLTATLDP